MPVSPSSQQRALRHAAVFVDYANLHALLAERLEANGAVHAYITEALEGLRRHLADEEDRSTVLTAAYADFEALTGGGDALQRLLYQQGVETRFAPAAPEDGAAQMQLAVDATRLVHRRPGVETVALMTGNHTFLPLVHALRREGVRAFVAALDPPPPGELTPAGDDAFMDFLNLLGDAARRDLLQSSDMPARQEQGASAARPAPAQADYDRLDDDMLVRTLEIAEEHFGQYDEVYLTPLLRKLSDVLGERFDPKALVSDLEEAGAVRLEKRRGYPYDYTVLIVERGHPDVQQMEDAFYDGARPHYERGGTSDRPATRASLDDTSSYGRPTDGRGESDPEEAGEYGDPAEDAQ